MSEGKRAALVARKVIHLANQPARLMRETRVEVKKQRGACFREAQPQTCCKVTCHHSTTNEREGLRSLRLSHRDLVEAGSLLQQEIYIEKCV